jgi:CheY-like chemotaxis protein
MDWSKTHGTSRRTSRRPQRGNEVNSASDLPVAADNAATRGPVEIVEPEVTEGRALRILVVDDNVDSADSLALLLSSYGHDVRAAYDGSSALEIAQSFRPEVALQDVSMPDMDGYEVARKLREFPHTRHAALIALSGFTQEEDARRARLAGFDHHLGKPVDFDLLHRVLRSL